MVYKKGDIVLFQDTGREHPKTYKFLQDFEAFEGIPVTRIRYKDSENPFSLLLSEKKYKVIPNMMKRICTVELKIKTAKRYLRSIGIRRFENYIGFRFDEPKRVSNRKNLFVNVMDKFPLYEGKITKNDIEKYWKEKPYTLEIPSILGNCTLCFMKGKNAILSILRDFPELANEWIIDEEFSEILNGKGNGRTYFPNITIKNLKDLASNNLFREHNLENIHPEFSCEC
jgi:hypothetical protein